MKRAIPLPLLLLLLLLTATHLEARPVMLWSYAQLHNGAEIVVLAKPLSNIETKDVLEGDEKGYIGINTEFQVMDTIKGDVGAKKFTVLHFKLAPNKPFEDGMWVVTFRLEGVKIDGVQTNPPEYLLFLSKSSDGRYEPVTGQMDAGQSVREVTPPY